MGTKNSRANKLKGTNAERAFEKRFKGSISRKATLDEDINDHYDYVLKGGVTVDVKSANKGEDTVRIETLRRWHALQYKYSDGVPNGVKSGWLFGRADYIAYLLPNNSFEFFKTKDLLGVYLENKDKLFHLNYDEGSQIAYIPRNLLVSPQVI